MMAFANVVSQIFEPPILISILFLVKTRSVFWVVAIMGPVLAYRVWLKKRAHLDWDITDRKKRIRPLLTLTLFLLAMSEVINVFEPRLFSLSVLFLIWMTVFFLITLRYKISGHVAVATIFAYFYPISFFIVPVVSWSRVVLKKHTVGEVIAGFLYSSFLYETWKSVFR